MSQTENITLQLDVFEGPLDLLLYLIKKNDLDISRIAIAKVTDQYLQYLETLQELDIDLVSDYLFMAAELAYIKSRSVLPHYDDEEDDGDDSVNDLIARLKEYERFKMAARDLKNRPWLHRDVFTRGSFGVGDDGEIHKKKNSEGEYEVDSFELIKAFAELLKRLPKEERNYHIVSERASVTDRIYEMLDVLKEKDAILFDELFFEDISKASRVLTFLSLLEMVKLKMIRLYQIESFGPIHIKRRIEVSEDVLKNEDIKENVESYR